MKVGGGFVDAVFSATANEYQVNTCHDAIGVLGAVSVATACLLPEGPALELAVIPDGDEKMLSIEHPTGEMSVIATIKDGEVHRAAVLRTARKLFDGVVFCD